MDNSATRAERERLDGKSALTKQEAETLAVLLGDGSQEESASDRLYRFYRRQINRAWKLILCGEGFSLRGARAWIRCCRADWNNRTYPRSQVRRAHMSGFSPAQIERFGIDTSRTGMDAALSEREYDYLQPINGKYNKWFTDRVSTRIVAGDDYCGLFEPVHFNIISRFGELLFVPLSPEAQAVAARFDSAEDAFFAFIDERGLEQLRVAGSAWRSQVRATIGAVPGEGGKTVYNMEGIAATRATVHAYIQQCTNKTPLVLYSAAPHNDEFIRFGNDMNASLRLIMYNEDGNTPLLGGAFLHVTNCAETNAEEPEDERPAIEEEDETFGQDSDCAALGYCALPIDIQTGTFAGGRVMLVGGECRNVTEFLDESVCTGVVPGWQRIVDALSAFCRSVPQIELLEFRVRITPCGFKVVGVNPSPRFNYAYPLMPALQAFLKGKVVDKRQNKKSSTALVNKAAFRRTRRAFTRTLYPAGMVFYQGLRYPHDVLEDLFCRNGISLSRKLWCYRHGFLSYRMDLYPELAEQNWENYLTDFEYRWLRHINPKYRSWMEDKITIKYLFSRYNQYLPAYYYFTSCRAGENRVIPLMDCPAGFEASMDDILRLAREVGVLALKPDEGSHGEGFYKLTYSAEGGYALNGEPATEERVLGILRDPDNQYLVSEYIDLHPDLKRIYPGSVNTVRVTVLKRDGVHPQVGNAYLRIGSERSGAVDNVVAGGFVAEVDVVTGKFGNARTLMDNRLVFESVHPDTGVPMEGILPRWDEVCRTVLALAEAVPQLEYLGFDVAITPNGLKLLEVNRYPDYPRISRLTPTTISYLLDRIAQKKRFVHIDTDRSLFKLPRRTA